MKTRYTVALSILAGLRSALLPFKRSMPRPNHRQMCSGNQCDESRAI